MEIIQVNGNRLNKALRYIKNRFANNTHESAQIAPFGDDSVPLVGTKGVKQATTTDAFQVILGYFSRNNVANEGEKRLYSLKLDGSESFYIYLKNNGTFEFGGTENFLVKYKELKIGFDQLKSDMNDLIIKYNTHVHPVAGSSTAVTTSTQLATTADISESKTDKITTL